VLFRHGDRAPIGSFPLDPNNSEALWPNGWAQLTKEGQAQHQRLGRWLRARYDSLLSPAWNASEITITSTAVDRTLNSAAADLQGLYSPLPAEYKYDPSLDWSPVPVRSVPAGQDQLLSVDRYCTAVKGEKARVEKLPEVQDMTQKAQPLFKLFSEKLGTEINDIDHLGFAYDSFHIQMIHNISVPEWVVPHIPELQEYQKYSFRLVGYTDTLKTLRGGPLISKMLTDMENKTSNNNGPNMFMYSGHDTTVAAHLQTLGVYNDLPPPYAACVVHELHDTAAGPVVKTFYRNDTVLPGGSAVPLQLTGCGEECPLERMRQLLDQYLPTDYAAQCGVGTVFGRFDYMVVIGLGALLAVMTVTTVTVTAMYCRAAARTHDYTPLLSA